MGGSWVVPDTGGSTGAVAGSGPETAAGASGVTLTSPAAFAIGGSLGVAGWACTTGSEAGIAAGASGAALTPPASCGVANGAVASLTG